MTEPKPRRPATSSTRRPPDRWDLWFWRGVQIIMVLVFLREILLVNPRLEVMGFACSLMFGARGAEKLLLAIHALR